MVIAVLPQSRSRCSSGCRCEGQERGLEAGAGDLEVVDAQRRDSPPEVVEPGLVDAVCPGRRGRAGRNVTVRPPYAARTSFGRAVGHDPAAGHQHRAVGERVGLGEVVGGEDDRAAVGGVGAHGVPELPAARPRPCRSSARPGSPDRGRGPAPGRTSAAAARLPSRPSPAGFASGPSPARSITTSTRSGRPCRAAIARTVSRTVKSGSSPPVCITAETRPSMTARCGLAPYTSTVPPVGDVSPRNMSTVVVLPAPLGPRNATISPDPMVRSIPSTAVTVLPSGRVKALVRPVARMAARAEVEGAGVLMPPAWPARRAPSPVRTSRPGDDTCHEYDDGAAPDCSGTAPHGRSGQNAASSRSISARSMASAMARSAVSRGRLVCAKNCAAATLPS